MSLYTDVVKDGSFLADYMEYMQPLETPLCYDFWCGVWLLSCAVGRRSFVARPHAPVYLNLYAVLCANAGITRKSTAVRRCEAVYRAAGYDAEAVTITASTTPEKLVEQLSVRTASGGAATACIINSELVTLLGQDTYNVALPGLLTDLYDCPSIRTYSKLSTGDRVIKDVFVNMLAASTPAWLVQAINPNVVEGGFTSRCLFIIDEKPKHRVAWPTDAEGPTPGRLAARLAHAHERAERWGSGGIQLSDAARERFTAWYNNRRINADDPFLSSFEAREDHHILRLAAFLCINDDEWRISTKHIERATKLIGDVKDNAGVLFGVHKEARRLTKGIDKLRDSLLRAGALGITQTDLLFKVRSFMSLRELDYALGIMHELEMVQRFDVPTRGRPKIVWRGTNKLLARNLNKLMMEKLDDA